MMRRLILLPVSVALITGFAGAQAAACSFVPDLRPYADRVVRANPAFIGTVSDVRDHRVTFTVEKRLFGQTGGATETIPQEQTTCHIQFERGQRWIFAGATVNSPSVMLQDAYGQDGYPDDTEWAAEVAAFVHQSGAPLIAQPKVTLRHDCTLWDDLAMAFSHDGKGFPAWTGGAVRGKIFSRLTPARDVRTYRTEASGLSETTDGALLWLQRGDKWAPVDGAISVAWDGKVPLVRVETADDGVLILRGAISPVLPKCD